MSDYSSLKATINANIKANNNHEITGAITNTVLNAMVDSLGAGYQFMGVATPTNPGTAQTPDYKCFYLATTPGKYTYLGGLVVADGEVAILKYDSSWHKEVTGAATVKQLNQLGQYVSNNEFIRAVTDADGRILYGVKSNGQFYFGAGCPNQVKEYVLGKIDELSLGEMPDVLTFLGDLVDGDNLITLLNAKANNSDMTVALNEKVDKVEEKSLIDEDYANSQSSPTNPEYASVVTDENNRVLGGRNRMGEIIENTPVHLPSATIMSASNEEWIYAILDISDNILFGIKRDGSLYWAKCVSPQTEELERNTKDLLYANEYLPIVDGDFNERLSRSEIISIYNSKLPAFCELCKCNLSSMYPLADANTDEVLLWKINHNFRKDVVFDWMSKRLFSSQLNKYFQIPIYRFDCAKINNTNTADCSLRVLFHPNLVSRVNVSGYTDSSFQCIYTGTQKEPFSIVGGEVVINNGWKAIPYDSSYPLYESGTNYNSGYTEMFEPSSLISDDGQKIELFGQIVYTESSDGVNWSEPVDLVFTPGHTVHSHSSVNKVDGIYMMVGCSTNNEGTPENPSYQDLWTSTDKINWEWRGHLISTNDDIGSGETFSIMGNSYLFKDNGGTYYLYYEGARETPWWETCLMTCTDLFYDRGNGYIGNWEQCSENPILPYNHNNPYVQNTNGHSYCNPEFIKGQDNQPLKINGRYYMVYLTGYRKSGITQDTLNRMYSYDLVHWVEEGAMLDNRDIADGGEALGDNGDQSLCEFKGKTYLFYTVNINSYGYSQANIRYTIDDRPLIELLKIKP